MAISPAEIRALQFSTVKRGGYDQREVESFKTAAADALEAALQESTAMEARARAAVARLQELTQQQPPADAEAASSAQAQPEAEARIEAAPAPEAPAPRTIAVDEAETISRTLLLAQRTADTTVAEAEAAAQDRLAAAESDAARIIEGAKAESRRAGEAERVKVEGEVQALLARRDFLESDVDHLDQHLQAQRERITEVVAELTSITGRVVNGLAPMRRPQLSASDHSGDQARPAAEEIPPAADDEDDLDVSSLIDQTREAGDTTSPVERPAPADDGNGNDADGPHDLFSPDDR
jgi:DivIVA domain-containing protein